MILTKKLVCPSCNVKLRVAESLPVGKTITCPKCGEEFPVPPPAGFEPAPEMKPRRRKPAPPPDDENYDEEVAKRPRPRKRSKKAKKETNNSPLILGLAIGGGVALAVGAIVAFMVWQKKSDQAAQNAPSRPMAMQPGPEPRPGGPGPVEGRMGMRPPPPRSGGGEPAPEPGPEPAAQNSMPTQTPTAQIPAGSDADLIAVGQNVFRASRCGRCHALGGAAGGARRGPRGPDLSRVGAVRSLDWLMVQIRDPKSHKPDSRMPPSPRISEDDLRALATYLASLK
jgi:mono/diheme cytochrome c family protein